MPTQESAIANVPAAARREAGTHRPASTYRLQLHAEFKFDDARKIVPYLSGLGITHVYASPILKACPGSMHGYDVIDHRVLNPELGSRADFDAFTEELKAANMGLIVDIVPNHMGVATNENAWWNDCLENGPASRHAEYFDIAWRDAGQPQLHDKVLLPVLGEPYGQALEQGKLRLTLEAGSLTVGYYERRFPLSIRSYGRILHHRIETLGEMPGGDVVLSEFEQLAKETGRADFTSRLATMIERRPSLGAFLTENIAIFNGRAGDPQTFDLLDQLLSDQFFRLAYWRTASDEINYRRFFDINDLAALRMERPDVFEASHAFLFEFLAEGRICGFRVDHPDGLLDPAEYFLRLQRNSSDPADTVAEQDRRPLYVVAEKILAADEPLPADWAVHGTTGYDYINKINALFVDQAAERSFDRHYRDWTSADAAFDEYCHQKKRLILGRSFAGELDRLARRLQRLGQRDRHWRDFTLNGIRHALGELIAVFPVYRTYVREDRISADDIGVVETAVGSAIKGNPDVDAPIFRFLRDVLLLQYPESFTEADRAEQREVVGKFQQLTPPVAAKGIEDTAFYVYNRLVSLNEVGGDPGRFGISSAALHAWLRDRQAQWPLGLSPLSTHDTKRSEDVRARLNVLSEFPDEWWQRVARWSRLNEPHRHPADGKPAPDPNDEYLLYQALLGAWPLESKGDDPAQTFVRRIQDYLRKAMREAKVHTSWTNPNVNHEEAVANFIGAILSREKSPLFLQDFRAFERRVSHFGLLNSLSQTLLRLTAPGIADTYQGTELWDFSLVDPDNRRPVDYPARQQLLAEIQRQFEAAADPARLVHEFVKAKEDGRAKLFVTWRGLTLRREHPELFERGEYIPLEMSGSRREHVFSFVRRHRETMALIVVPRFLSRLGSAGELPLGQRAWGDTSLILPANLCGGTLKDRFTNQTVAAQSNEDGMSRIRVSDVLTHFPLALLCASNRA